MSADSPGAAYCTGKLVRVVCDGPRPFVAGIVAGIFLGKREFTPCYQRASADAHRGHRRCHVVSR
jgi:hypothetical protein